MNIKTILEESICELNKSGIENSFFEARELLASILKENKEWISAHIDYEVTTDKHIEFLKLIKRRISGEPFQYILGVQGFMGREFLVNKRVLIPRADTEILVYEAIKIAKKISAKNILDMCTGSGCIAISLVKELKDINIFASDISAEALKVAKRNTILNNCKIKFFESNLFDNIPRKLKFDMIVSNPPYISEEDMLLLPNDVKNEPEMALRGGKDGLEFYRRIAKYAYDFLAPKGILAFEIGYNQADDVERLLQLNAFSNIYRVRDYSDNNRVVIGEKGDKNYE